MFGVIQRVVSGEDVTMSDNIMENQNTHDNNDGSIGRSDNTETQTPTSNNYNNNINNSTPAIIESEFDGYNTNYNNVPNAPITHIPEPASGAFTTSSSLSDTSQNEESKMPPSRTNSSSPQPMDCSYPDEIVETNERANMTRNDSRVSSDSSSESMRASSQNSSRDWGWFEDVHASEHVASPYHKRKDATNDKAAKKKGKKVGGMVPQEGSSDGLSEIIHTNIVNDANAMAVTAPTYVLEESLSSQKLWKDTAGTRPPQPVEERAFYEKMWAQNFARSQVEYRMPVEVLTATSPISLSPFADGNFEAAGGSGLASYITTSDNNESNTKNVAEATLMSRLNDPTTSNDFSAKVLEPHHYQHMVVNKKVKGTGSDEDLTVLVRGDNVFGTTVSKAFARSTDKGGPIVGVDTVNISIASYRVVESKKHGKYAQFLVIYREGSIRDTIGVWKRYSDFEELSKRVTHAHEGCAAVIANISPLAMTEEHEVEHLPNSIKSWRLVKKRKRWYRCLDAGYLSLKVFLLERFLHDILFESSNPKLLREFVGTDLAIQ